MGAICDDLEAEHEALDEIVCNLSESQWCTDTPAAGWDVADTIVHIAQADIAARLAVTEPDVFQEAKAKMFSGDADLASLFGSRGDMSGADVLGWWRDERTQMVAAFRMLGSGDRIKWFGPPMSTMSFVTARLMETWSHGHDVADTVGAGWSPTDRIRHVAHMGVTTRGWSYFNRGLEVPEGTVRVELVSPAGEVWAWGPSDAPDTLKGSAHEFCLVVTQRCHPASTDLEAVGDLAAEWLSIAQCFAGPPTLPSTERVHQAAQ